MWSCRVVDNEIFRKHGVVGGKITEPSSYKCNKNNLRSAPQQAQLEAERLWIGKLDKGYSPDPADVGGMEIFKRVMDQKAQNGGMNRGVKMHGDSQIKSGSTAGKKQVQRHYPMLAKKYKSDDGLSLTPVASKLEFPLYVQAKVDGLRALPSYGASTQSVTLESRNGKAYVHLDHIRDALGRLLRKIGDTDIVFDGELYVHHVKDESTGAALSNVERFQLLSEMCKITRTNAHPRESVAQFWIFDIWDPETTFEKRYYKLKRVEALVKADKSLNSVIKFVPTKLVNSHDEIESYMDDMIGVTTGRLNYEFEGVMVRVRDAYYDSRLNYHSSRLLKYKKFMDEEWEICGAESCNGTHEGAIKWKCKKIVDGVERELTAKQTGTVESSRLLFDEYTQNSDKFMGRSINIRFNERTKEGVPRFPRAIAFVDDKS